MVTLVLLLRTDGPEFMALRTVSYWTGKYRSGGLRRRVKHVFSFGCVGMRRQVLRLGPDEREARVNPSGGYEVDHFRKRYGVLMTLNP